MTLKIGIITAIREEYFAVLSFLENVTEEEADGVVFSEGVLKQRQGLTPSGPIEVILPAPSNAGNVSSAILATRLIRHKPGLLAMIGCAGGIPKKANLYDVIFADRVIYYEPAKDTADGLVPRPDQHRPLDMLLQRARLESMVEDWKSLVDDPIDTPYHARVEPIAAGERLLNAPKSELMRLINAERAVAVEMEGFGVMEAAHRFNVHAVVVRGISDLLDKSPDDETGPDGKYVAPLNLRQVKASKNAMAFFCKVLSKVNLDTLKQSGVNSPFLTPSSVQDKSYIGLGKTNVELLPVVRPLVLTTDEIFRELLAEHEEAFFARVWNEIRSTDLSVEAPHRQLFSSLCNDPKVRQHFSSRQLGLPAVLLDPIRRQGQLSLAMKTELSTAQLEVAISPVCVGAVACFLYLRNELKVPLRLRYDAALAVNFLSRVGSGSEPSPPNVIVGQDAIAVASICTKTDPKYFPLLAAFYVEHCILRPIGIATNLPVRSGLLGVPNESPNALTRKFEQVVGPNLRSWNVFTQDITTHLATAGAFKGVKDLRLYSFGIVGDFAEWLGIGRVQPLSGLIDDEKISAIASGSLGAMVICERVEKNRVLKEAVLVAFLLSYRELSANSKIARLMVKAMLADEEYTSCLAQALGYAAILREKLK